MTRRGTASLLELLVALALAGVILATAGAMLRMMSRDAASRQLVLRRERDHTAIWGVMSHQLRAAAAAEVTTSGTGSIAYPRPVGEAPACHTGGTTVTVPRDQWHGERLPDPARDRALVHDGTAAGGWHSRGIVSVSVANCPSGTPGLAIGLGAAVPSAALIRVDEAVQLRHYQGGGLGWVGLESLSGGGVIQPLAGPLPASEFLVQALPWLVTLDLWAGSPFVAGMVAVLGAPP